MFGHLKLCVENFQTAMSWSTYEWILVSHNSLTCIIASCVEPSQRPSLLKDSRSPNTTKSAGSLFHGMLQKTPLFKNICLFVNVFGLGHYKRSPFLKIYVSLLFKFQNPVVSVRGCSESPPFQWEPLPKFPFLNPWWVIVIPGEWLLLRRFSSKLSWSWWHIYTAFIYMSTNRDAIRIRIRIVYWWNAETTIIHQDLWLGN